MIRIIEEVGQERGIAHITWHGFRRGRAMDVLGGLEQIEPSSCLTGTVRFWWVEGRVGVYFQLYSRRRRKYLVVRA